jgi:hypothetical protein
LAKCSDAHSYTNCDPYYHANSYSYPGTKRHADGYTNVYAEASADPEASSDSTAEALGVCWKRK